MISDYEFPEFLEQRAFIPMFQSIQKKVGQGSFYKFILLAKDQPKMIQLNGMDEHKKTTVKPIGNWKKVIYKAIYFANIISSVRVQDFYKNIS